MRQQQRLRDRVSARRAVELTNEDVADILALLDSLPYDELDLQTPRFRLTLRRAPDGGWTQSRQVTREPTVLDAAPAGAGTVTASSAGSATPAARPGSGPVTSTVPGGTGAMAPADCADEASGAEGLTGNAADRAGRPAGPGNPAAAPGVAPAGGASGDAAGAGNPEAADTAETAETADTADTGDTADTAVLAGLVDVVAPLPGTFYRAPWPGAAPFVEVGSAVREDTVVAIVETMKLMNSVHAGTRGRVAAICLGNAEPVAQGGTLMRIEPGQ